MDALQQEMKAFKKETLDRIEEFKKEVQSGQVNIQFKLEVLQNKLDPPGSQKKPMKDIESIKMYDFKSYKKVRPKQQRWLLQFKGHVYILEGNIGSGKSTLGRILETYCNERNIPCVFMPERFPEETLSQFIIFGDEHPNELNPFAYPLQRGILHLRHQTYTDALKLANEGNVVFIDRSLPGDYVFALLNYCMGNFTEEQWQEYRTLVDEVDFLEPSAMINLDVLPQACMRRINTRTRSEENKYTLKYITDIDIFYKRVLSTITYPILTLPWSDERKVDDPAVCKTIAVSVFKGLEQLLHSDCESNNIRIVV